MFNQELIEQKLTELNEAWHDCAATAYGHTLEEMQASVTRLDAAQDWFKDRNIKLDYDGETGNHALSAEQPTWRNPSHQFSHREYLEKLERGRRRHRWF